VILPPLVFAGVEYGPRTGLKDKRCIKKFVFVVEANNAVEISLQLLSTSSPLLEELEKKKIF
jgi:hypothetical protein